MYQEGEFAKNSVLFELINYVTKVKNERVLC